MPLMGSYELFTNSRYNEQLILIAKLFLIFIVATYLYNTYMLIKTNDDFGNTRVLIMLGILALIMFFYNY